jgi:hypothetical protein
MIKPFDIVMTKAGAVGVVCETYTVMGTCGTFWKASVEWFKIFDETIVAWWGEDELTVIDNLPDVLSRRMAHPSGTGGDQPYSLKRRSLEANLFEARMGLDESFDKT